MDEKDEQLELEYATQKIGDEKEARYQQIKEEARQKYAAFKPARCPALNNSEVFFTSEGFNHLIYRIPKQERNKRVQIMRFELLDKARELILKSTTMQEYEEYLDQVKTWMNKKPAVKNVVVKDVGLVGVIRGYRIKVVIRKVGNGKFEFLSVIPAWSTKYYHGIKVVRNTKGNVAD
jgi:hypothetical protein